jgi:hypothetical protein
MTDRDYTPYQRKVIQRHYKNQDTMRGQRISEMISEIYLATTPKKRATLWARMQKLLEDGGLPAPEVARIVGSQDVEALARLVEKGFGN